MQGTINNGFLGSISINYEEASVFFVHIIIVNIALVRWNRCCLQPLKFR